MSKLRQLIYISRATRVLTDEEAEALVNRAASNNRKQGITGALLYLQGAFIQVLEGEADAISGLLDRLKRDTRHRDLRLLQDVEVQDRQFKNWSMGMVQTPTADKPEVLRELSALDELGVPDDSSGADMPLCQTFMMMQRLYETDKVLQRARNH